MTLSRSHTSQEAKLGILWYSFVSLFLLMTVVKPPFFFLRYNDMCWAFCCFARPGTMARRKANLHDHAFVPFPRAALPLHWGHPCPWKTVEMKLSSEERGDLLRNYDETHQQKRPNPELRVAGCGECPVPGSPRLPCPRGTASETVAEEVPMGSCCLPPCCSLNTTGPEYSQKLLAMASKCPPRARERQWHCVSNK